MEIEHLHIADVEVAIMPLTDDLTGLTAAQIADVNSLHIEKRRRERVAVYQLINACLSHGALIGHTPDGAPYLVDFDDLKFSLSHCATSVAIAWSRTADAVGVDIEDQSDRLARVAERFVRPEESGLPLLALWTAKEATFKAFSQLSKKAPTVTLIDISVSPDLRHATVAGYTFTLHLTPTLALAYAQR